MSIGNEELDFRNICRACLSTKDLNPLYDNYSSKVGLMHMFMSCTFVRFYEDDGLPTQICNECVRKITAAYEFSLQCQKTDEILRNYIQKLIETTKNSIAKFSSSIHNESNHSKIDCSKLKTTPNEIKTVTSKVETEIIHKYSFKTQNLTANDAFELKSEVIVDLDKYKDVNLSIQNDHNYLRNNNDKINLESLEVEKEIFTSEMKQSLAEILSKKYGNNYPNTKYLVRLKPLTKLATSVKTTKLSEDKQTFDNAMLTRSGRFNQSISKIKKTTKQSKEDSKIIKYKKLANKETLNGSNVEQLSINNQIEPLNNETLSDNNQSQLSNCPELSNFEFNTENERNDFDCIENYQSNLIDFVTNELSTVETCTTVNIESTSASLKIDSIEVKNTGSVLKLKKKRIKSDANDSKSSKIKRKPPYECKKCGEKFPLYRLLREHFKTIPHKYTRKPCPICAKPVTYWYFLRHVDSHKGLRPYICEICGKSFVNISNYKRHQYIHLGVKPFTCDICGKGFPQAFCLKEHRRIHTGERPFICYKCGKTFRSSVYLKQHLDKHEQEKASGEETTEEPKLPITCSICNQIYPTLRGFKTHSATHQEKHFCCSICGKYFVTDYRLKMHERYYHGQRKFACDICQKTFSMRNSFKQHMVSHSGRKDFSCEVCCRKFNSYGHIRYHMLTHTGEKPHKCSVCGKAFAGNGNLVVHMRTHTGETPYYCPVCQKGFYDSSSMKKHCTGHSKTK